MKKGILVALMLSLAVLQAKAGDYTANSFGLWPPSGGWMISPASGPGAWQQGPLDMGSGVSPDSGCDGTLNFAEFDSWDYSTGVMGDIISPQITLPSPADDCSLSFYVWNHSSDYNYDTLLIQITTDGGGNWSDIDTLAGDIDSWLFQAFPLSAYAGQTVQVRFRAKSDYGYSNMGIDEVRIGRRPLHDASVVSVINPGASMPGPASPVAIVANKGTGPETFEVICRIDSAGTEVYADSKFVTGLAAGARQEVSFNSYSPAIGNGSVYSATFNTVLAGDGDPNNDTLARAFNTYSVQRKVLAMDFTGTWCVNCPWHQVGWGILKDAVGDSIVVMAIHWSDSFQVATYSNYLYSYYTSGGALPTSVMDGTIEWIGAFTSDSGITQSNKFRYGFDKQIVKRSPFELLLDGHCYGDTGTLDVTIKYPGASSIPTAIRVAIVQTSKFQPWGTVLPQDSLFDIMRSVITPTSGDTFNAINGSNLRSYFFTLNSAWDKTKLNFVAWAEKQGEKECLQAGEIPLSELTGVTGESGLPGQVLKTRLLPCYPNPGSGKVTFSYILASAGQVELRVYDICGRMVQTVQNGQQKAGSYNVEWHCCGQDGQKLSNGVYFYKLSTGEYSAVKKLTILR